MDATEDSDLKLQRASADLIRDFKASLPAFLRHPYVKHPYGHSTVRKFAWRTTLESLVRLLEPFQEWPQLLDPHLPSLLPLLIDAFLEYVGKYYLERPRHPSKGDIVSLSEAICRLLYTFCKIRGAKVISGFFSNESRWIEPILSAFVNWDQAKSVESRDGSDLPNGLAWQESYVMLTWLSHLMLTPFDLASISAGEIQEDYQKSLPFKGPPSIPALAHNIISVSTSHLARAGKERDAAATLLVKFALRPDMQREGMLQSLVQWVLAALNNFEEASMSLYESIAHLSVLAKIVSSADASVAEPYLLPIFECVQTIAVTQIPGSAALYTSALTRKSVIKIVRSISTVALQLSHTQNSMAPSGIAEDILEEVIELLLGACSDKDTPVRLAASKAIGIVCLKLEPEQATQVAQAVTDKLEENVFWEESILDQLITNSSHTSASEQSLRSRNLNAVDALAWQGLTLSLSNLLFRRCPPPALLPDILNSLLLALSFVQRSPTGVSMGANVRDAACYGIWSLARKYTSAELLSIDASTVQVIANASEPLSILQILANELVVTSSIDPSGNIRRGASAALQEMVGRHPDSILNGIALIQVVDYNAVALRRRALTEVVPHAAKLHAVYWEALFAGLLGWRALGSPDASTRRLAAQSFGLLSVTQGLDVFFMAIARLRHRILKIGSRNVEIQHGLILALVASLEQFDQSAGLEVRVQATSSVSTLWEIVASNSALAEGSFASKASHPQLFAEAACLLVAVLSKNFRKNSLGGTSYRTPPSMALAKCVTIVTLSLERSEPLVIKSAVEALQELFSLLQQEDRHDFTAKLLSHVDYKQADTTKVMSSKTVDGYMAGLGSIFAQIEEDDPARESIEDAFVKHLEGDASVETKVATLESLKRGMLQSTNVPIALIQTIKNNLKDYTTDQRGDVGSLVRIEAIGNVLLAWQSGTLNLSTGRDLFARTVGLAAEKLDKVRSRAWHCLCGIQAVEHSFGNLKHQMQFSTGLHVSSQQYFQNLLCFTSLSWVQQPLLEGYVTTAGTGPESVLRAARSALDAHLQNRDDDGLRDFASAFQKVLETSLTKERLAVSTLEVLAFVLDTRSLNRLAEATLNPRRLLYLVQKSHYKSTSIPKLKAAIEVYIGLCSLPSVKQQALAKLRAMLLHPYPQVRNAAADAIFSVTQKHQILHVNWTTSPKDLKSVVAEIDALV